MLESDIKESDSYGQEELIMKALTEARKQKAKCIRYDCPLKRKEIING